jgi:hypothetical protein
MIYQLWEKGEEGFVFNEQKFRELVSNIPNGNYLVSFQLIEPKSDEKTNRKFQERSS